MVRGWLNPLNFGKPHFKFEFTGGQLNLGIGSLRPDMGVKKQFFQKRDATNKIYIHIKGNKKVI